MGILWETIRRYGHLGEVEYQATIGGASVGLFRRMRGWTLFSRPLGIELDIPEDFDTPEELHKEATQRLLAKIEDQMEVLEFVLDRLKKVQVVK